MGRPGSSSALLLNGGGGPREGEAEGFSYTRGRNLGLAVGVGVALPTLLPLLHMLLFTALWGDMTNPVDKKACSCSCWDTVFKGPYESGVAGFKHVYFNSTWNSLKMWVVTVLGVIFLYETFKHVALLGFKGRLRGSMALVVVSSVHSHYYAWWGHWNYWNDEFYAMWAHQLFFTVTELASTAAVLVNIDRRRPVRPLPLLFVANVAVFHILSSGLDQFFFNVVSFQGRLHQVLRDVVLMSTDVVQVGVVLYELRRNAKERGVPLRQLLRQKGALWVMGVSTSLMTLYVTLYP